MIESDFLKPQKQFLTIPGLPPYGFTKLPLSFRPTSINTLRSTSVKISVLGQTFYEDLKIVPVYNTRWGIIGGVLIGVFTFPIFAIAAKFRSLFIQRPRR